LFSLLNKYSFHCCLAWRQLSGYRCLMKTIKTDNNENNDNNYNS